MTPNVADLAMANLQCECLSLSKCSLAGAIDFGDRARSIGAMECRAGCGACCIAPSITSPIPGLPQGKPAGLRCVQLDAEKRCRIFGQPERPAVCGSLRPSVEMCGSSQEHALTFLNHLEWRTTPYR